MTVKRMERIFKRHADKVQGQPGAWEVYSGGRVLLVFTDEASNRMRIFSPIRESESLHREELETLLEANFYSALDAKYSLWEGFVISVFTHPLKELTEAQLVDAMHQVSKLAKTYGSTYSSTDLIFMPGLDTQDSEKKLNQSPGGKTKRS